ARPPTVSPELRRKARRSRAVEAIPSARAERRVFAAVPALRLTSMAWTSVTIGFVVALHVFTFRVARLRPLLVRGLRLRLADSAGRNECRARRQAGQRPEKAATSDRCPVRRFPAFITSHRTPPPCLCDLPDEGPAALGWSGAGTPCGRSAPISRRARKPWSRCR